MPSSADSSLLPAHVAVLSAMIRVLTVLRVLGLDLVRAATIAVAGTAGAVEIGCRPTDPYPAPKTRVTVLVIILVILVQLVGLGYPPIPKLATVLCAFSVAAEIARLLTGRPYPQLKLLY
jgi:hypothetical protein